MTDAEINIAIAEIVKYDEEKHAWSCNDPECEECGYGYKGHGREKPNYCSDLNAMHEAWCWLSLDQKVQFSNALAWVLFKVHSDPLVEMVFKRDELSIFANATARQRAEAFLRTIGKWKE